MDLLFILIQIKSPLEEPANKQSSLFFEKSKHIYSLTTIPKFTISVSKYPKI